MWDFSSGTVDKSPPANAGDMGLIPGLERCHMPRSNQACAPQPLKSAFLEPVFCNETSCCNEKPRYHPRPERPAQASIFWGGPRVAGQPGLMEVRERSSHNGRTEWEGAQETFQRELSLFSMSLLCGIKTIKQPEKKSNERCARLLP